jgi:hypothetical protein
VRLAGIKVSLLQRMRVKIDGKRVSLPYIKLGALSVMKDGYRVILRTNEGKCFILFFKTFFVVNALISHYRSHKLCNLGQFAQQD